MTDKKILVIGSVNVDHFMQVASLPKKGETVAGKDYHIVGGGKGANQALACARLGGRIRFIASIGADKFGQNLVSQFQSDGVDTSLIEIVESEKTGVALIFVDEQAENVIGVNAGANGNLSPELVKANESAIADADFVLMQLEIPMEATIEAAHIARKYKTKVVLNPAPARPLPDSLLACVDIITPNQTEAEALTGVKVDSQDDARRAAEVLHQKGIGVAVITMGNKGVYLSCQGRGDFIGAIAVDAVDTTAAGDVFNGAFLVAMAKDQSALDSAYFANQCAALSVTRAGAQTSVPYIEEVQALQGKVGNNNSSYS